MGSLNSIKRTMVNKVNQDAPQYVEPVNPPSRLPASNPAFIGAGIGVGVGGVAAYGGRRLGRINQADPRSAFLKRRGKRLVLAGAGLAAYGTYALNRNTKNGYAP